MSRIERFEIAGEVVRFTVDDERSIDGELVRSYVRRHTDPLSPRATDALRAAIVDAHRRGDTATVTKLQMIYRVSAAVCADDSRVLSRPRVSPILLVPRGLDGDRPRSPVAVVPRSSTCAVRWTPTVVQILSVDGEHDGAERGGPLLGRHVAERIQIELAGVTGQWDERSAYRFAPDVDRWNAMADAHGLDIVGDWHAHPYGIGVPSSTDRDSWASELRDARSRAWVGVIAYQRPDGRLRFSMHLTTKDGASTRCAPIEIEEAWTWQ